MFNTPEFKELLELIQILHADGHHVVFDYSKHVDNFSLMVWENGNKTNKKPTISHQGFYDKNRFNESIKTLNTTLKNFIYATENNKEGSQN